MCVYDNILVLSYLLCYLLLEVYYKPFHDKVSDQNIATVEAAKFLYVELSWQLRIYIFSFLQKCFVINFFKKIIVENIRRLMSNFICMYIF